VARGLLNTFVRWAPRVHARNIFGKDFKDGTGLAIWDREEASGLTCVSDACTDGHRARMFALA
jgi:hypothetical protein